MSQHSQLNAQIAVQLFDFIQNIYVNNVVFSKILFDTLRQLIERNIDQPNFQAYLQKYLRTVLNSYVETEALSFKHKSSTLYNFKLCLIANLIITVLQQDIDAINEPFAKEAYDCHQRLIKLRGQENNDLEYFLKILNF